MKCYYANDDDNNDDADDDDDVDAVKCAATLINMQLMLLLSSSKFFLFCSLLLYCSFPAAPHCIRPGFDRSSNTFSLNNLQNYMLFYFIMTHFILRAYRLLWQFVCARACGVDASEANWMPSSSSSKIKLH